jgi:hypothetical protein
MLAAHHSWIGPASGLHRAAEVDTPMSAEASSPPVSPHTKRARFALIGAAIALALFIGLAVDTLDPAPGESTNGPDVWAVALLVVCGVLATVAVVEFVIGGTSRKTGWYPDPTRIHRMRYRESGRWTKWAADGDRMVDDAASLPLVQRRRRRRWAVGAALVVIGASILVGCVAIMNDAETSGVSEVRAEMDTWKLPASVKPSPHADHVERGTFGATTPTVTRWLLPVATTADVAVRDLVAALREQGYAFTRYTDEYGTEWSADCRYNSKYCSIDLTVDERGRIEVLVDPGG